MKKKWIWIGVSIVLATAILCVSLLAFLVWIPQAREREEWERTVREYYAAKLALYETENARYADYEVDVAFLGDSLTDGYDLTRYYPEFTVANRGIGGETTYGLKSRMQTSVYDLKPKVAVMLIGGNNLPTMFEDYEDLLVGLKTNLPNTEVVLLSLTAMGKDWAHKNELACYNNVKIELLAKKYGYSFVDLFTPLFDLQTGEINAAYTTDGAHFTAAGYEVVTAAVKPVLEDLLGK